MALLGLNGYASVYCLILILNLVCTARLFPHALKSIRSKNWVNLSIWIFLVSFIATIPWIFYIGSLLAGNINVAFFIITPIAALIQNFLVWRADSENRGKSTLIINITIVFINFFLDFYAKLHNISWPVKCSMDNVSKYPLMFPIFFQVNCFFIKNHIKWIPLT